MSTFSNPDYSEPVSRLLDVGDPRGQSEWPNYLLLYGLNRLHIPDLIRMAVDEELNSADSEFAEVWAPLHAWRTLGQLGAVEAILPLLSLMHHVDDDGDDWVGEDLPIVFGLIGPAAIAALADYLADDHHGVWARTAVIISIGEIEKRHPESRADCAAAIVHSLERFDENDPTMNAELVLALAQFRRPETYPLVERAFQAEKVDFSVNGDWEDFQVEVGLLDARITPDPEYDFSLNDFIKDDYSIDLHKAHSKEDKKVKSKRKARKTGKRKNRFISKSK